MVVPTIVFRSKIDTWLAVVLVGTAVAMAGAIVTVILKGSTLNVLILVPLFFLTGAYPLWLMRSTFYVLDEEELQIRSGPFKWNVKLMDIRAMTPTRNPLASPALSLDRLRIEYGRWESVIISPSDRDLFLRAIEQRQLLQREIASPPELK